MKIYLTDIVQASSELLKVLEKEKVETNYDLQRMRDRVIRINERDLVEFKKAPTTETSMYITSYIRSGSGIPIELRVNPTFNYAQIILKTQTQVAKYDTFAMDPFRNIIQNRVFLPGDLGSLKEELKRLNSIKDR
ncbi:MAG: hypothetical protein V1645_03855 [archaeon]